MKKAINAVSVIIEEDNKILLAKRVKDNLWITPGGEIDDNETPKEAILREVLEELNVKLFNVSEFGEYVFNDGAEQYLTKVYIGKIKGKIKLKADELSEYKWFSPDEALQLPLFSSNRDRILDYVKIKNYFE